MNFAIDSNRVILGMLLALLLVTATSVLAEDEEAFIPSVEYRTIRAPEHGGGPLRNYVAPVFDQIETLLSTKEYRLVVSTALPPSTSTRTVVAGVFLLIPNGSGWQVADQLRFEAAGKASNAKVRVTSSGAGEPRFMVEVFHGGRGYSYSQAASYVIRPFKFVFDTPGSKES